MPFLSGPLSMEVPGSNWSLWKSFLLYTWYGQTYVQRQIFREFNLKKKKKKFNEDMFLIAIKHLEINQILALSNPSGVDMPLNKEPKPFHYIGMFQH